MLNSTDTVLSPKLINNTTIHHHPKGMCTLSLDHIVDTSQPIDIDVRQRWRKVRLRCLTYTSTLSDIILLPPFLTRSSFFYLMHFMQEEYLLLGRDAFRTTSLPPRAIIGGYTLCCGDTDSYVGLCMSQQKCIKVPLLAFPSVLRFT